MKNSHINSICEVAVDNQYYNKGKMGTESGSVELSINDSELDTILDYKVTEVEIYGQVIEIETDSSEMKIWFSYSEEK